MAFQILDEADVPVQDLHEDPQNANVHDERSIESKVASLKAFGQPERLVVRKSDRRVFSGNGRLTAMVRLAWPRARVQYVEGTDDECRAYALVANRSGRLSRFNDARVLEQLTGFQDRSPDLVMAAGWSDAELKTLMGEVTVPAFEPASRAQQSALDKVQRTIACPSCGHEFHP